MTPTRPTAPTEPRYYTVSQAAARLGVSRITIWRWIRDGHLPAMRFGPRTTRVKREDVERALARIEESGSRSSRPETGIGGDGEPRPASPFLVGLHAAAHSVRFYADDADLIEVAAEFIGTGLSSGDTAIVAASEPHRIGVEARLREWGLDLDAAIAGGRYTSPDAAEMLDRFLVAGTPDAERYAETVRAIVAGLDRSRPVRQFGEVSPLLAARGNSAAAVRLEQLANELQSQIPFSRLCAYRIGDFAADAVGDLSDICSAHDVIIPVESYAQLLTERDRSHAVVALQQRVHWLETQLDERQREIDELRQALAAEQEAHQEALIVQSNRDGIFPITAYD